MLEYTGVYSGIYWSILEYTGVYWSIQEYTGAYRSIQEYVSSLFNGRKSFSPLRYNIFVEENVIHQSLEFAESVE